MAFAEIQEDMALYKHPISKESFRAPSSADFKQLTEFFIEEIYGKRPEDFSQPAFGCLDQVEYAELYEEAIPRLQTFRQAQKLFFDAKFEEFGLRDVHAPERGRFHWELSALINLMKFRQSRLAVFEEMTTNADDLAGRETAAVEERTRFEAEITRIKELRKKDEPEVEALRELVSDLGLKLSALHKQQLELAERTREMKGGLTKRTEYAASVKVRRVGMKDEVERMRARVVSSPERVQGRIGEMERRVGAEEEMLEGLERRGRLVGMRVAGLGRAEEIVVRTVGEMEGLVGGEERVKGLRRQCEEVRKVLKEREEEVGKSVEYNRHLEREVFSGEGRLERLGDRSCLEMGEEGKLWSDKERTCVQEVEKGRTVERERRVAEKVIQKEIDDILGRFVAEVEVLETAQQAIVTKFGSYQSDLGKACDLINADGKDSLGAFKEMLV